MRRSKFNIFNILLAVAIIVTVFICAKVVIDLIGSDDNIDYRPLDEGVVYNDKVYKFKSNLDTTLIIGLDKEYDELSGTYTNNQQNDFLLLIVFDEDDNKTSLITINRDTICEVDELSIDGKSLGTKKMQIALAHNYGSGGGDSCRNVRDAVSRLFSNININHYVSVTMDAVEIVNNQVGGVEVDGTILFGQGALNYVRKRSELENPTNVERMKRQEKYIEALMRKVKEAYLDDEDFLGDSLLDVNKYLVSDMTVSQMTNLSNEIVLSNIGEIISIDGEANYDHEFAEFNVDSDSLLKTIVDVFCVAK